MHITHFYSAIIITITIFLFLFYMQEFSSKENFSKMRYKILGGLFSMRCS